nr:NTP transferase domain-containing protein [Leucobacter luti]
MPANPSLCTGFHPRVCPAPGRLRVRVGRESRPRSAREETVGDRTVSSNSNAWVVIPARGGSVGVPRKNVRELAGKPLIHYAIETALTVVPADRVWVVTDDDEIAAVARAGGARTVRETMPTPPEETLDTKILRTLPRLREAGARESDVVVTVQPTSPLLRPESLERVIRAFDDENTASALTVALDQHLRWGHDADGGVVPLYAARVNRQQLPREYRETGGAIAARLRTIAESGTRIAEPVEVVVVDQDEAIDIDNFADVLAAAHILTRLRIAIRVDASRTRGMGHVYRMLALASELARHSITIYLGEEAPLGAKFFASRPYPTATVSDEDEFIGHLERTQPDLVVLDVLDTDAATISRIRAAVPGCRVISFEDNGPGAGLVDLLIAEFVDVGDVPGERVLSGIDFALLGPGFERSRLGAAADGAALPEKPEVQEVLVLFGGTDPAGLSARALASLARVGYRGNVTVARGLGAPAIHFEAAQAPFTLEVLSDVQDMPGLMRRADFAFTSAGRTIVELLSQGTPSLCLAQNEKELTHTHATAAHGVLALGLGDAVSDAELDGAVRTLLDDHELRHDYAERAARAGALRSNRRTISEIFTRLGFAELSIP